MPAVATKRPKVDMIKMLADHKKKQAAKKAAAATPAKPVDPTATFQTDTGVQSLSPEAAAGTTVQYAHRKLKGQVVTESFFDWYRVNTQIKFSDIQVSE